MQTLWQIIPQARDSITHLFQATMARTSFSVIVRWAAFSPLTNFEGPDHSLDLVGGPTRNPENMLVFYRQSDDTIASSANLAGLTGGNLSFSFSSSKMVSPLLGVNGDSERLATILNCVFLCKDCMCPSRKCFQTCWNMLEIGN